MTANNIILISLYCLPLILLAYVIKLFSLALLQDRLSVFKQMRHYFDGQKGGLINFYSRPDMIKQFEQSGLLSIGFTPTTFRVVRDASFFILAVIINIRFLLNMDEPFPVSALLVLLVLYIALQLRKSFPIAYILKGLKVQFERQKNAEIFILQQLISNEYADNNTTKQNIYHMFMYMRRFLKHIRPAVDRFLEEYPQDPHNKEKAFRSFSEMVGTTEAETLAEILYQVDQSSPEEIHELLTKRYEELKTKRQEAYRGAMKDRGVVAYVLTFLGIMMVIICGLYVYFLEYKDMMNATYNMY